MKARSSLEEIWSWALATMTVLVLPTWAQAQFADRDGWVEEPAAKSLNVEGDSGHAYLDSASVHRGDDGLVYFNESSNVMRPEQIGKVGLMEDAYDCAKNIKYTCVEKGDWRNDRNSTINSSDDPALPVYRKYLLRRHQSRWRPRELSRAPAVEICQGIAGPIRARRRTTVEYGRRRPGDM